MRNQIKKITFANSIIITAMLFVNTNAFSQSAFNSTKLENAIINYVVNENKCESKVEIAQVIKSQKFSQKGVNARISHTEDLIGNCKVQLSFYDGTEIIHKEVVRLNVRVYAKVPVAQRFIGKDVKIEIDDIAMQKMEVTNIDPNSVVEINEAIGKLSKKGISKGSIIQYTDITSSNDITIKKNDKVNLLHYSGTILIKTEGVALEGGSAGSVIKVKKGHQTLYGFIADDGYVVIEDKNKLAKN
jgi:flagella basal body P-ring formation protein FlgA